MPLLDDHSNCKRARSDSPRKLREQYKRAFDLVKDQVCFDISATRHLLLSGHGRLTTNDALAEQRLVVNFWTLCRPRFGDLLITNRGLSVTPTEQVQTFSTKLDAQAIVCWDCLGLLGYELYDCLLSIEEVCIKKRLSSLRDPPSKQPHDPSSSPPQRIK